MNSIPYLCEAFHLCEIRSSSSEVKTCRFPFLRFCTCAVSRVCKHLGVGIVANLNVPHTPHLYVFFTCVSVEKKSKTRKIPACFICGVQKYDLLGSSGKQSPVHTLNICGILYMCEASHSE